MTERKAVGSPLRHNSHVGDAEPSDGQYGEWPRKTLVEMDRQFRERVEHAFRHGAETPPVAAKPPRLR
jgi:hypothetical protein